MKHTWSEDKYGVTACTVCGKYAKDGANTRCSGSRAWMNNYRQSGPNTWEKKKSSTTQKF